MLYSLLADLLLAIHLLFIVFVVLGALLVLKWHRLGWLHLPAVAWGALVEFNSWPCPLTPWEVQLRRLAGEQGFESGFIEHYIGPLVYPAGLTPNIQIVLGSFVIIINLVLYSGLLLYFKRKSVRTKRG